MWQIFERLRDWWRPKPIPPPGPRRVKHYSAQTGFQYRYQLLHSTPGDYEFHVSTTTMPAFLLRITVPLNHLVARDRYALAKLHLFRNLDECEPANLPRHLEVTDTAALDEL